MPSSFVGILKDLLYIGLAIIFFGGLFVINSIGLGESDLGVWATYGLGFIFIFLGMMFYFFSGFVRIFYDVDATFGIIVFLLGLFTLFRATRRRGQFVYVR